MIKLAMLWCELNQKNTMLQTISEALDFYVKKYNHVPDLVTVNPNEFDPDDEYPIQVLPWQYTLPRHIFIGISEENI